MKSFQFKFFLVAGFVYLVAIVAHLILIDSFEFSLRSGHILYDIKIFHPHYFIFWFLLLLTLFFAYFYKYLVKKQFLQQTQKKSDEMLQLIDEFVIITKTNLQGQITYASAAFCKVSGFNQEELLGNTHSLIRHPHNPSSLFENLWETILDGKVWHGEIKNRSKDGKDFWLYGNIIPEFDELGTICGFTGVKSDTTHTKNNEVLNQQLHTQLENYNAVIKNANSGIGTMTIHGDFLTVNSAFSKLFGYTESELVGKNCIDMTVESQKDAAKLYLSFALNHGKIYKVNKVCTKKDNSIINIEMSLDLLPSKKEFVVVINSLEDKLKLQKALNRAELLYKNAAVGFMIVDKKGHISDVNQKLCEIVGFSETELKTLHASALHTSHEAYKLFLQKVNEQCLKKFVQIEFELLTKANTTVWCEITGYPHNKKMALDDESTIWTISNITDKVNFRNSLLEQSKNLEQQVQLEVEKNIQNQKFYLEDKVSSAKFTAIGKLAAGITHEINTPLTYIKGNLEMMNLDIDDIESLGLKIQLKEDITKVFTGIQRIENIVESMREMSQKSSEGKEKTNIYATLITALTMAYNRSKHIARIHINNQIFEIGTNKHQQTYYANVQSQRIEQVWINIINNALDELVKIERFDSRALQITIFNNDNEIVVQFCDNAGGIQEDLLENLFDPFVSTKVHGGMGVGLNICKRIIEDNDGTLKAYNQNDGAVFEIHLKAID